MNITGGYQLGHMTFRFNSDACVCARDTGIPYMYLYVHLYVCLCWMFCSLSDACDPIVFFQVPTSEMLGDDAEVELKRKVPDALVFADDEFVPALLKNLNTMRKNKQFCDVILQVGASQIALVVTPSHSMALECMEFGGDGTEPQKDTTSSEKATGIRAQFITFTFDMARTLLYIIGIYHLT